MVSHQFSRTSQDTVNMAASTLLDSIRGVGSHMTAFINSQPLIKGYVEYAQNHPWITLGVATGVVIVYKIITHPRDLPPGPFNWPILGAVSYLRTDMEVKLLEMRPVYGDIIRLKLLGNEMVILNSEKVIREAFLKRSSEFSNFKVVHFLRDISSKEMADIMTDDGGWLTNKKFIVTAMKSAGFGTSRSESKIHSNLEKLETVLLDQDGQPFSPADDLKSYAAALIFSIYFDENLAFDDPKLSKFLTLATEWSKGFNEGYVMYDFILGEYPLLRKVLCRQALQTSRKSQLTLENEIKAMIKDHHESFDERNVRDMIDYYICHQRDISDNFITFNIMISLPDAIDTSGVILAWLLFYLAKHQYVQKKLQDQIDDTIGMDRKPALSDRPKLPYADAIVLEMLRCVDIATVTAPRELKEDVEFGGYRIPKGAGVMASLHSVHYDPDIFPEPDKFDPTRFLNDSGKLMPSMMSHVYAFSLGPRMCMAEQYTKVQLFLALTTLTQKFSITFDPSQPEPPLSRDPSSGFIKIPVPHKLCFNPR